MSTFSCILIVLVIVGGMADHRSHSSDGPQRDRLQKVVAPAGHEGDNPALLPGLVYHPEGFWGGEGEADCSTCSSRSKAVMVVPSGKELPIRRNDCPRKSTLTPRAVDIITSTSVRLIRAKHRDKYRPMKDHIRKSGGVVSGWTGNHGNQQEVALILVQETLANQLESLDTDKPGRKRNLKNYHERLATYTAGSIRWPRTVPKAEALARVGFVYTGQDTAVECLTCGCRISEWEGVNDPLLAHFTQQPRCPFLLENFKQELETQSLLPGTAKYANNSLRLHTFELWPIGEVVTSYQLASVGFYYPGTGREVICFSCGVSYDRWKKGDVPLLVHRQLSPSCQFLQQLLTKAPAQPVPLDTPSSRPLTSSQRLPPSFQPLPSTSRLPSTSQALPPSSQALPPPSRTLSPSPAQGPPSRPDYANEQVRLKSFKYLSPDFPCSKQDCARAGLYFVRKPDVMKCFSCDATVRDWIPGDVAVEKHREVSPACKFLREFCASKLEKSSDEGFDPDILPGPHYTQQELQELPSQAERLSLSDSRPPFSFPYSSAVHPASSSSSAVHPTSSSSKRPSSVPSQSHPPHIHSKSWEPRPPSTAHAPIMPRPHRREEYAGPSYTMYHPSPVATPTAGELPSHRPLDSQPSAVLPPSYQPVPYSPPANAAATPYPHRQAHLSPPPSLGDDNKLCVVCMDEPLQMVLVPCGHVCVCEDCSKQLNFCPMCRRPVDQAIRVFLPY